MPSARTSNDNPGTSHHRSIAVASGLFVLVTLAACGADDDVSGARGESAATGGSDAATGNPGAPPEDGAAAVIDPDDRGSYDPAIDPADFLDRVDNPYFPLVPGSRWVYEGESDGETERVEVVVTEETREVMGITATVVRDRVWVDGELVEDTDDWFAQDSEGNVWYLGEDSSDFEDGEVVSTEGSWEAGVDGALPGIVMPANPSVGHAYRQEYFPGEAEDMGEVIAVGGTVTVPAGRFADVVTTRDWTPLEPEVIEQKQYAPGIGPIREEHVAGDQGLLELVEHSVPD